MTNLSDMPDDVLIKLFNITSPRDVTRVKRLNRRFNGVVEGYNLGKPRVRELRIQTRSTEQPPKIGRIRFGAKTPENLAPPKKLVLTMKHGEKGQKIVENEPTCSKSAFIEENLRKIVINETLNLEGLTIDEEFHKTLCAKWNDLSKIENLSLNFCKIEIPMEKFANLLEKMRLKSLVFDFCTFEPSLICDRLFENLKMLEILKIQPRSHCFFEKFTDFTLTSWKSRGFVPKEIGLYNCATSISIEGIRNLMETIPTQKIDWDFGLLILEPAGSNSELLLSLMFSSGFELQVNDDFQSRRLKLQKNRDFQLAFNIRHVFPMPQPPQTL
ncbi:unnamed protein product [Caenorhabditis angaria]|uniref:F-box domain-containing protein n=1 Tax=Caenorhabditis angaria TaxID=860376 RepID=A0A9P1N4Y0_9PELO|nr:unnamed protein product [Caenorhabditis angaria]